ncbi:hypothetical protein KUTeg_012126 [Tegillarca granosa]|uniref:Uncharacterized protein n=1 Tax=Tegillarca granosa TaxID=220873 RepID=A0ABQ9F117_TEGGR|nr:hypothetical protein KUTeg_012126 [Tegillarca granosa]
MEKAPSDGVPRTASRNSLNPKSPLPPIGGSGDHVTDDKIESDSVGEESEDNELEQVDEEIEDDKSTISHASSASLDRPGEGPARPAIIRGFRREMTSEMSPGPEKDRDEPPEGSSAQQRRSVSFSASSSVKQREKSMATKETARRTTYDGREITFITLDTQTDWNWVEEASTTGNVRVLEPSEKKADSRASGVSSKG